MGWHPVHETLQTVQAAWRTVEFELLQVGPPPFLVQGGPLGLAYRAHCRAGVARVACQERATCRRIQLRMALLVTLH